MGEYTVNGILESTIFTRFKLTDKAEEFYYLQLRDYAKDVKLFDKVCTDLSESSRFTPTVTDIKTMYRELGNHTKDKYAVPLLTELQQKESSWCKTIFFNIRKTMREKHMRYNDACEDLQLDKEWKLSLDKVT